MNRDEAKTILLLYRPDTADADDPQIIQALALAKQDPELARWLQVHFARQFVVREKFRQITAPAGLKEQIISEQAAKEIKISPRPKKLTFVLAVALLLLLAAPAVFIFSNHSPENTLAIYQNQMAGIALRGYTMDLTTNDFQQIRNYLAKKQATADFILPAGLEKMSLLGCAVESWQNQKISMVCFHTDKKSLPDAPPDLWLFVVDRTAIKNAPSESALEFSNVNRLAAATWVEKGKLYFLGTTADAQILRRLL